MQERVTLKIKQRAKRVIIMSTAVVLVAVIFCIAIIVTLKKKRLNILDETTYYFVYTHKDKKQSLLLPKIDSLKSSGGAGVIHFYREDYYLIVSIYKTKAEAEEVKNNIKGSFPESGVLAIQSKKIKKSTGKAIKKDVQTLALLKNFYLLCDNLIKMSIDYLSGSISQNQFSVELLKVKLELEEKLRQFDAQTDVQKTLFNHLNLCVLQLNNFFSKFFESTKKESMICEIAVNLNLLRLELTNNL